MTDISEQEYPLLVAQDGPLKGQRWAISQTLVIGREPNCDLVIPSRKVSRYHARLTPTKEGIILEDMGSKNGTYCNSDELTTQIVLQDGDLLQIALAQQFMFLTSDATMPLTEDVSIQGRLMIDLSARRVWINQQLVIPPLSAQQFRLLWVLYENLGQVVSRPDVVVAVWGEDEAPGVSDQALDALIRRLRDRLASIDPAHQYVDTIRGHGVRLDNPAA
ncbi:MAG: FHA domain-containing protein [Anaerolineales bacterium]|nr:FHA domain-containing protein [Anaerolineales bacterium]